MTETHDETVARLKAEIAALRAGNDAALADAQTAINNLEKAIQRKEADLRIDLSS